MFHLFINNWGETTLPYGKNSTFTLLTYEESVEFHP